MKQLLDFVKFTNQFNKVKRRIYINGEDRFESDSEHSYQLALVAWYIISSNKLPLNMDKVFEYAIAHDLIEIYAGDTFFHTKDKELVHSKKQREMIAFKMIVNEFPEFKNLHKAINDYEEQVNEETRFVYALDKVIAAMNVYLDRGRVWRENNVTLEMERKVDEKVKGSKEVEDIWKDFVKILEKEEDSLFVKE
jgi:putative hydrolase of HD superfamily